MIPVQSLYQNCAIMLADKWGYIWGTAGVMWNQNRQKAVSDSTAKEYGSKWIGHMVADCSGVMVYIWRQFGLSIYHGSNSIARKYCGTLAKTPKPGYAAFKWRSKDTDKYPDGKGDFYHIGIVAKDGKTVYEAKGTQTGFTTSPASTWQYFAPFKDVDYNEVSTPMTTKTGYVTLTSGTLNVRSATSTSATSLGKLPNGATVNIISEPNSDWYGIKYNGATGYVAKKYITIPETKTTTTEMKWGIFIPCMTEVEAKQLQAEHKGAIITCYESSNGEDG